MRSAMNAAQLDAEIDGVVVNGKVEQTMEYQSAAS